MIHNNDKTIKIILIIIIKIINNIILIYIYKLLIYDIFFFFVNIKFYLYNYLYSLNNITEEGETTLQRLRIADVFDLRSPPEVQKKGIIDAR